MKAHFAIFAIAATLCAGSPLCAETAAPRLITVTGNAVIKVVPDQVTLLLGVETWDADLNQAKAANQKALAAVISTAKTFGIPSKDIQTDYIGIEPEYRDRRDQEGHSTGRTTLGFFVRRSAVLTLRDIGQFESLLTATLAAGANHVQGITFETSELRRHRDAARAQAINAAREKAVALAGKLGQTVGKPQSITEGYTGWGSSYGSWWGGGRRGMMAQNTLQSANGPAASENAIEPGRISVSADVTVSFLLE